MFTDFADTLLSGVSAIIELHTVNIRRDINELKNMLSNADENGIVQNVLNLSAFKQKYNFLMPFRNLEELDKLIKSLENFEIRQEFVRKFVLLI